MVFGKCVVFGNSTDRMPSGPQDLLGFNFTSLFITCSSVNGLNCVLFSHLSVFIGKVWRIGDSSVKTDAMMSLWLFHSLIFADSQPLNRQYNTNFNYSQKYKTV